MGDTNSELNLRITEGCPTQQALNAAARAIFEHPSIQAHLKGTRFRLLSLQALEPSDKSHNSVAPERYRATVYDCTNNRSLLVEGQLAHPQNLEVSVSSEQPLPTDEEFDAAVAILQRDETIGRAICDQNLQVYRPMPPLIATELPDGRIERTLAVGLFSPNDAPRHRIVGVVCRSFPARSGPWRRAHSRTELGAPQLVRERFLLELQGIVPQPTPRRWPQPSFPPTPRSDSV